MVKILDCTTRDGGHTKNWNFSDEFIIKLITCLEKSKISFYEIGYRNFYDTEGKGLFYRCDKGLLEKFWTLKENVQFVVMTDTKRFNANDFPNGEDDFVDYVRIACHPDRIKETFEIANNLYQKGYKIFIQLMDISNVDEMGYNVISGCQYKNKFESIYMADSYGTLTPNEVEKYYNKLKASGCEKISFHAHNNKNLALENTLKAIDLGAYSVDVTLNGIGRAGGNLNAAELLDNLEGFSSEYYRNLIL